MLLSKGVLFNVGEIDQQLALLVEIQYFIRLLGLPVFLGLFNALQVVLSQLQVFHFASQRVGLFLLVLDALDERLLSQVHLV